MSGNDIPSSTSGYADEADDLFVRYEAYDPAQLLTYVSIHFPPPPARVLDIGAGTGRDAAWFARQGYDVTAVEPVDVLRERAKHVHPEAGILWMADSLPRLAHLRSLGKRFDVLMLSAVWMHLDQDERAAAMRALADLSAPRAVVGMTLRHGPVPPGRRMFDVSGDETRTLALDCGFHVLDVADSNAMERSTEKAGVTWSKLAFRFGES